MMGPQCGRYPDLSSGWPACMSVASHDSKASRWARPLRGCWRSRPACRCSLGAWVLLASGLVLSREMTWDLLFNLAGAWHIEHGHVPHRDFHDPLGPLSFALTNLGFRFAGPTAMAFIVGELIALAMLFPVAVVAAAGRLAPLPAFLVVLYVGLLILQPANVGDLLYAYSFAMLYNRWAWAALTILGLLLFVDPRRVKDEAMARPCHGRRTRHLPLLPEDHLRRGRHRRHGRRDRHRQARARAVAVVGRARGADRPHIAAPFNHSYLRDTWQFAMSGYARVDMLGHLNVFAANRAELTLYAARSDCWCGCGSPAEPDSRS